jgi:hypothetical protein
METNKSPIASSRENTSRLQALGSIADAATSGFDTIYDDHARCFGPSPGASSTFDAEIDGLVHDVFTSF